MENREETGNVADSNVTRIPSLIEGETTDRLDLVENRQINNSDSNATGNASAHEIYTIELLNIEQNTDSNATENSLPNFDMIPHLNFLLTRLNDCGYIKEINLKILKIIQERGVANIVKEQLAAEIKPIAVAMVSDDIHDEMLKRIREASE